MMSCCSSAHTGDDKSVDAVNVSFRSETPLGTPQYWGFRIRELVCPPESPQGRRPSVTV